MAEKLLNMGPVSVPIPVVNGDGARDTVTLQPGGRLTLPLGYKVDPGFAAAGHPKVYVNGTPMGNVNKGA